MGYNVDQEASTMTAQIVRINPPDWEKHDVVQIDVEAADNREAVFKIEEWAAQNGFARVNEYWLRPILSNGKRVFRGICYRLTPEEIQSAQAISDEVDRRLSELHAELQQSKD
jgi:hypothetical protein